MIRGSDSELPWAPHTHSVTHTVAVVHGAMLVQICRTYHVLPDVRAMTMSEIRFWYDGIRGELKAATKSG